MTKFFTLLLLISLNVYAQVDDGYLLKTGNYSVVPFKVETNNKKNSNNGSSHESVKIMFPARTDTILSRDSTGMEFYKAIKRDCFYVDHLVDSIPLKQLDSLLNAEITALAVHHKQKIIRMGIDVYRSNGEFHGIEYFEGNKIALCKEITSYLKKKPQNSYLVLQNISFTNSKNEKIIFRDKFAWKIIVPKETNLPNVK